MEAKRDYIISSKSHDDVHSIFHDTRHSEVNDTDTSCSWWQVQFKWQHMISYSSLSGMSIFLLFPMRLKTLQMHPFRRYWGLQAKPEANVCFLHLEHLLCLPLFPYRLTARRVKSPSSLRWKIFKNCNWKRSSFYMQSTKSDPKTISTLALERTFPGSPPLLASI